MKNRFIASMIVLILALATVFAAGLRAQTTEEGPGPSQQTNAPKETGQAYPEDDDQADSAPPANVSAVAGDHGVPRITMLPGDVSTQRGDSGYSSAAAL